MNDNPSPPLPLVERVSGHLRQMASYQRVRITGQLLGQCVAELQHLHESVEALSTALRDAISTYGDKDEIVVTAERQEAWQAVLDKHGTPGKDSP